MQSRQKHRNARLNVPLALCCNVAESQLKAELARDQFVLDKQNKLRRDQRDADESATVFKNPMNSDNADEQVSIRSAHRSPARFSRGLCRRRHHRSQVGMTRPAAIRILTMTFSDLMGEWTFALPL